MKRGQARSGKRWSVLVLGAVLVVAGAWVGADARNNVPATYSDKSRQEWVTPAAPVFDRRMHFAGGVWMSLENDGKWGNDHGGGGICREDMNLLKVNYCPAFETPGGSRIDYLYNGGLWIGGIVGTDTLVSLAYEGWTGAGAEFISHAPMRVGLPPGYRSFNGVVGEDARHLEQVYYTVYSDTTLTPSLASTHTPMGIEIVQATHQGSDAFSRDFVIFDLTITNVGENLIENMYFSIFNDCDAFHRQGGGDTFQDDISGFLGTWPNKIDPTFRDTLNVGWAADNDGDPEDGHWDRRSTRGVMGWRILRQPEGTRQSFNWWTSDQTARQDWGPRMATDTRNLGHGGNGTPSGDRNKYHYMMNNEMDYGQLLSAEDLTADGWRPPPNTAVGCNLADGLDTRSMLTVGPVKEFRPGESVPFTFALIGGNNIHVDPLNTFECNDPYAYIGNLEFDDLAQNAWWAGFIFDNHGIDSDNDGYGGKSFAGSNPPVYYSGDGVPDFSGPEGPRCPAPEGTCDTFPEDYQVTGTVDYDSIVCGGANMWLVSRPQELEIGWSGAETELAPDPLILIPDWEGYRIYIADGEDRSDIPLPEQYALLASWDRPDFRRYTRIPFTDIWRVSSHPKIIEDWREEFNDETFDPADHPPPARSGSAPPAPYEYPDPNNPTRMLEAYFEMQDYNLGNTIDVGAGIDGPNLIQRIDVKDSVIVRDDGGVDTIGQYGIYNVIIKPTLPTRHYFVSVTAFDFGNPSNDLPPSESPVGDCFVDGIPINSADVVEANNLRVGVYPNPYKGSFLVDGVRTSYFEQGFEGKDLGQATDEARRIHFINLPDTATIRIYSLDGDLVRELQHPDPVLTSYSSKISWDLVSRNTQAVESGIYIYRVDSKLGTQMGKIVIIK